MENGGARRAKQEAGAQSVGEAGQAGGSGKAGGGVGAGRRPYCVLPLTITTPLLGLQSAQGV